MTTTENELRISVDEAKAKIDAGSALVLDLVQPGAWSELDGAIEGAVRIPPDEIEERYGELPIEPEIIAYCT